MDDISDIMIYLKCKSYYHLKKYKEVIAISTNQLKNNYLNDMQKMYLALSYYKLENYNLSIKTAKEIKNGNKYIKFFKFNILADSSYKLKNYKNAVIYYLNVINKTYLMRNHKIKNEFLNNNFEENLFLNTFYSYYNLNQFSNCITVFNKYYSYIKKQNNKNKILLLTHNFIQTNKLKINKKTKFTLAQELYYAGKKKIANNYFKDLISLPGKDSTKLKAYFFTALIHKDDKSLFNKYLVEMKKKFNSSDLSLYHYARAYYLIGKWEIALNYHKKIIFGGKDKKIIKNSFTEIINIYQKSNNNQKYEEFVKKFHVRFKSERESSKLFFKIGLEKLNKGDISKAVKIFSDLESNKYYSIRSIYFLGKAYYNQKEYEKAYQFFFKVIDKSSSLDFYLIKSIEYFNSLDNNNIRNKILKKIEQYKNNDLKYNFLFYVITKKNKYRKKVFSIINKKKEIKKMTFGTNKINLKNDKDFKNYIIFKQNGLHDEAYLLYKILKQKYKASLDFYYTMLLYSIKNNWLGNNLMYRNHIIYKFKLYPYLICFDKEYLKYYYPCHYKEVINEVIEKNNIKINKKLIFSLIREESRFDRLALSPANAMGLFQIIPSTAIYIKKKYKFKTDDTLFNLNVNVSLGLYYFNNLLKNDDIENIIYALCGYNAGYSRIVQWKKSYNFKKDYPEIFIELIPFDETRNYVKKILTSYYLYSLM